MTTSRASLSLELVMLTMRSSAILVVNRRTATRYDYEYGFLSFELVMLTMRFLAILVVNRRTAARFDLITILRTRQTCEESGRTKNRIFVVGNSYSMLKMIPSILTR